jgi:hypothetical protein
MEYDNAPIAIMGLEFRNPKPGDFSLITRAIQPSTNHAWITILSSRHPSEDTIRSQT